MAAMNKATSCGGVGVGCWFGEEAECLRASQVYFSMVRLGFGNERVKRRTVGCEGLEIGAKGKTGAAKVAGSRVAFAQGESERKQP